MTSFEFQSVLFNFHDVILVMTALQCLFFGILLCITNTNHVKSVYFLAAFLFSHTLIPINELIMWGAEFAAQIQQSLPNIYFIPTVAYYLDAPFLYVCINYLVFKDFKLRKLQLIHLLPLLAYLCFISLTFFAYDEEQRLNMIASQSFAYSANFVTLEFVNKSIRIAYLIACFVLINRYKDLLRDNLSTMATAHITWLTSLVTGFLAVMIIEAILTGIKLIILFDPFEASGVFFTIGLTGNYITFVLVNLLVFTSMRHFWIFEKVTDKSPIPNQVEEQFINPEIASQIGVKIRESKIYMVPDLTIDSLADSLEMMPRDLSMLINRHFGVNFYEFVNRYRIDEAKRMLISNDYKKTTITDIYLAVGFNSKSVFYTFFKKFEGMTPSKYRQSSEKT